MKKRMVIIAILVVALCISCVLVACNKGKSDKTVDTVYVVTSTGTVLCSISADGSVSTEKIVYEQNGLNVYSWVAKVSGENVRVIDDEKLVMDGEKYLARKFNEEKLIVYPEKYYTDVNVSGGAPQKAIIGEVPTALPVPQKGYAEFIGYYYVNDKDEKVMLTNENGNFFYPWSLNVKSIDLIADFDMKPIGVELKYCLDDVNDKNESSVPDYIYYGDTLSFAFPLPTAQDRYVFEGWYSEENAGVMIVDNKGSYNVNEFKSDTAQNLRFSIVEKDEDATYPYEVTFYARWRAASHRVDYYNGDDLIKTLAINYGENVPNLEAPTAPGGKQFAYWYQGSDEDTPYDFSTAKMGVYDVTLRCKWKDTIGACSNCGQTIDADGYPVCVSVYCPNCQELFRGAIASHQFEDDDIDTPATCGAEGVGKKKCTVCGEVEEYAIPALQHEYVFKDKVPATCSQQGYISFECVNCHALDVRYEDVVVDHKFNTSRVEATKYELGYTSNKCVYCRAFVNKYFDLKDNSYITISTKDELLNAAKTGNANYVLMDNVSLDDDVWTPWGLNEDGSITPFEGIFNGNGYTISGIKITQVPYGDKAYGTDELTVGFFAELNGTVINLNLTGTIICDMLNASDAIYVGGVTGKANENSVIMGVNVTLSAKINDPSVNYGGDLMFGGLAGIAKGRIENSGVATASIGGVDGFRVYGYNYTTAGGLVGLLDEGAFLFTSVARFENELFNNSFEVSSKVASVSMGGIAGVNKGFLDLTAASGYMRSAAALVSYAGGLVGENQGVAYKSMASVSIESQGADEKQSFAAYTIAKNSGEVYKLTANSERASGNCSTTNANLMTFVDLLDRRNATFGSDYDLFEHTEGRMPRPLGYVDYLKKLDDVIVLDADYYMKGEYDLRDFNFSAILEKMEGSLRKFVLQGSYNLRYGDTYMPECGTVSGVRYFFGSFDGQGNKVRKFKFASGTTSLFKYNYGTVENIELTFYFHEDKDLPAAYLMGVVEKNKGEVDGCVVDGNYKVRMKKGLQIFLGIFVTIIFLAIIFGIESGINSDYEIYPFSYVAAGIEILIVGLCFFLGFFYSSTRLAVYMAITTAAMSLWPCIHTSALAGYSDATGFPAMIFHWLGLAGAVAFAVIGLTIL